MMALKATLDLAKNELRVESSPSRSVTLTVTDRGSTASAEGIYPLTVTDDSGRVWRLESDDGAVAIYRGG